MDYFVKATNNESGVLTQTLSPSETSVCHVSPVPDKAPGFITINIGESNEEEIYYETKNDAAGTINTLTRDTSNLNGGSGQEHLSNAPWETAQSATYINQIVDGLLVGHNQSGEHVLANNEAYQAKDSGGTARNGMKINASDVLEIGDSNLYEAVKSKYGFVIMKRNSSYSVSAGSEVKVDFDTVVRDDLGTEADTSNDRVTVARDGIYFIGWAIYIASPETGKRFQGFIKINGGTPEAVNIGSFRDSFSHSFASQIITGSSVQKLSAGDYVELYYKKDSGSDEDIIPYLEVVPIRYI